MKRRIFAIFTLLSLLFSCIPAASAAVDPITLLTSGGHIKLTDDIEVTGLIELRQDTVLDLNGFTISASGGSMATIHVSAGVSFSCKKGTLDHVRIENRGHISYLDTLTITAPILNFGVIDIIARCVMTSESNCISNSSDIKLIYDCDLYSDDFSVIENADDTCASSSDTDRKVSIDVIRHCRLQGNQSGMYARALSTHRGLVEDSILLGQSRAVHVYGGDPVIFRNCTIIAADSDKTDKSFAIRTIGTEEPKPVLEDCTLIATDYACGDFETLGPPTGYIEHAKMTNCTFIKRSKVRNLNPYLEWEMESTLEDPTTPAGLSNFTQSAVYTPGQFTDLSESHWGAPSIARAYELGLMSGTDTGFQPDGTVSLAQAITMAARLHSTYYADTAAFAPTGGAWYQPFVDYALTNGILSSGFDNYNRPAKRHEFAAILAAALPADAMGAINTVGDNTIPDVPANHPSAPAIYTFYRAGILTGTDAAGTFAPDLQINRAAAAVILTHLADPNLRVHT